MANDDINPVLLKAEKGPAKNYSDAGDGSHEHLLIIQCVRGGLLTTAVLTVIYAQVLQGYIDSLWEWLLTTWVYNSVYFETWFVTLCYATLTLIPLFMDKLRNCDRYKINPSVRYKHTTVLGMVVDAIIYDTPLMLLDTFKIKRYSGISADVIVEKEKHWIQTTRPLPFEPPTVFQLVFQLAASILLFDAIFFLIHYVFHRHSLLYKHIHRHHHKHELLYCHVTNQLTIPERLALILSANEALKIFSSHPLTRTIFVPVFIWMLIDNHSGYDVPWGAQHVIPFRLYGGPVKHYFHHENGRKFYQPFFTYFDKWLQRDINNSYTDKAITDMKEE